MKEVRKRGYLALPVGDSSPYRQCLVRVLRKSSRYHRLQCCRHGCFLRRRGFHALVPDPSGTARYCSRAWVRASSAGPTRVTPTASPVPVSTAFSLGSGAAAISRFVSSARSAVTARSRAAKPAGRRGAAARPSCALRCSGRPMRAGFYPWSFSGRPGARPTEPRAESLYAWGLYGGGSFIRMGFIRAAPRRAASPDGTAPDG